MQHELYTAGYLQAKTASLLLSIEFGSGKTEMSTRKLFDLCILCVIIAHVRLRIVQGRYHIPCKGIS